MLMIVGHVAHLLLFASLTSQKPRRARAIGGGDRARAGGARSRAVTEGDTTAAIAAEARDLVRRAAGDVVGLTVAAQIRQAARHLGYATDDWRPRELWYGRCASAAALDDLRRRFAAWRERTGSKRAGKDDTSGRPALAQRLDAIRRGLAELQREVDELAAEIEGLNEGGPSHDG